MSLTHNFPSSRLRHRIRKWRYRRRYPWRTPSETRPGVSAHDPIVERDDPKPQHPRPAKGEKSPDLLTAGKSELELKLDLMEPAVGPWRRPWSWIGGDRAVRLMIDHRLSIALLLAGVLAYLVILSVILTLRATGDLERGRSALFQARDELARGSFAQAAVNFETARSEFVTAQFTMDNPFVSLAASIPLIGRTPDAIRTAAEAGLLVTDAGEGLSSAVQRLRGGLEALSLSGDRIPVRRLQAFQPAVVDALSEVKDAEWLAKGIATTFVPRAVAEAGDQLRSALHRSVSALTSTDAILRALPVFTGMERPYRFFLAPQDPAELRGTGGAFSYWAILKFHRGQISLQTFHYIEELPISGDPEWPSQALERAYGSLNAAGDWEYANAPADGPTAAAFISQLWEQTGKKPVDGVIMIDVQALGSMLEVTGPVLVPGVPYTLTSDNAVSFLTNGAYLMPGSANERLDYVRLAALGIFQDFLAKARGYPAIRALVDAATGNHILMNATDPALQSDLQIAGVTGAIAPAPGDDLFALTINNLAGNRVDYYVRRTIDYDVALLPDGRGRATASVTFENDSTLDPPTSALASLLLPRAGPDDLEPGETYEQATISCGPQCDLIGASVDGVDLPMTAHAVGGLKTFTGILRTPPQRASTLTMTFDLGHVWHGDGAQGTYALNIPTQPVILRTAGTVTIHAPDGMTIAAASPGIPTRGDSVTWRGIVADDLNIRIRFQRDTLGRIWWGLKSVL